MRKKDKQLLAILIFLGIIVVVYLSRGTVFSAYWPPGDPTGEQWYNDGSALWFYLVDSCIEARDIRGYVHSIICVNNAVVSGCSGYATDITTISRHCCLTTPDEADVMWNTPCAVTTTTTTTAPLCPTVYEPVCGSDGQTYSNSCYAEHAGIAVICEGECPCAQPVPTELVAIGVLVLLLGGLIYYKKVKKR